MKKMGARIKQVRGEMSLLEFEAIAHVSRSMLSLYENGEAWPKPDTLNNIAAHGNVGVEWLLGYDATSAIDPPTKDDLIRLVLTSDTALTQKIKDDLRHQIQEETPTYNAALSPEEKKLLNCFMALDERRRDRLLKEADYLCSAYEEETAEKMRSNMGHIVGPDVFIDPRTNRIDTGLPMVGIKKRMVPTKSAQKRKH